MKTKTYIISGKSYLLFYLEIKVVMESGSTKIKNVDGKSIPRIEKVVGQFEKLPIPMRIRD